MKKLLLPLFLCTSLAGCFDARLELDFTGGEDVEVSFLSSLPSSIYVLAGEDPSFCEGGELTRTADIVSCEVTEDSTVTTLISGDGKALAESQMTSESSKVRRLGDGKVEVSFDLAEAARAAAKEQGQDIAEMEDLAQIIFADHAFTLVVSGPKIVSSSGKVSSDGTTASLVVPLADLVGAPERLGGPFVTVVDTRAR